MGDILYFLEFHVFFHYTGIVLPFIFSEMLNSNYMFDFKSDTLFILRIMGTIILVDTLVYLLGKYIGGPKLKKVDTAFLLVPLRIIPLFGIISPYLLGAREYGLGKNILIGFVVVIYGAILGLLADSYFSSNYMFSYIIMLLISGGGIFIITYFNRK